MARSMRWMLLGLILSLAFLGAFQKNFAAAEVDTEDDDLIFEDEDTADLYGDEEELDFDLEDEDDDWEIGPSPDVQTAFWFPDYSEHVFPLGKPLDVVVNLRNQGPQTFNVSYVQVAFRSPFDLSFYIQNFTAKPVGAVLGPDQELNIEYTFLPEPSLDPTKFWMTGYVGFSNSAGRQYQHTWTDKTIEMVAGEFQFDLTSVFQYGLLLAIAAGGAYLAFFRFSQSGKSRGGSKTAIGARRGGRGKGKGRTSEGTADDEAGSGGWDAAFYTADKASRSVRRRTKKSK